VKIEDFVVSLRRGTITDITRCRSCFDIGPWFRVCVICSASLHNLSTNTIQRQAQRPCSSNSTFAERPKPLWGFQKRNSGEGGILKVQEKLWSVRIFHSMLGQRSFCNFLRQKGWFHVDESQFQLVHCSDREFVRPALLPAFFAGRGSMRTLPIVGSSKPNDGKDNGRSRNTQLDHLQGISYDIQSPPIFLLHLAQLAMPF
jgi:hypothetical protein